MLLTNIIIPYIRNLLVCLCDNDKAYSRIRKIRCAMPGRSTVYYLVNKPDKLLKTSFEISGSEVY